VTFLRLETFGGLSLVGAEGPVLLSQRRRLALLALLAVAGNRGMQRDKMLGYLWPESTPDSARHSLDQLVYGLRHELGQSLFVGSNPLLLNSTILGSDVAEFESALDAGALAEAERLYRGPFLDGFYITGLSEFEEWTSVQRQRLAETYAGALEKLADEARQKGDLNHSVDLWRKRAALDNLSARGALGLMRALAEAGDRGGALQYAAVYERLVSQQLQSAPDREVKAFAEELRRAPAETSHVRQPAGQNAAGSALPSAAPPAREPDEVAISRASSGEAASQAMQPEGRGAATVRRSVPIPVMRSRRRPRAGLALAALAIAIAILVTVSWVRTRPGGNTAAALDKNRVVVLPFRFAGSDSSLAYLAEGVMDLLAARLTGEGGPTAIDPRRAMSAWRSRAGSTDSVAAEDIALAVARDVGAGEALSGELVATGDGRLEFSGWLVDARTGTSVARTTVTGRPDSLFALVDQLAARLLALRAGNDERSTAALTTTSLTALRAFLEGRVENRRGHSAAAIRAFNRALEFDSTFALAAVDLALATGRLFQWKNLKTDTVPQTSGIAFGLGRPGSTDYARQWDRALQIATRERARLSSRDRALLHAVRGNYPDPTDARTVLSNWEAAVQAGPDRADAQYWLGYVLFYQGRAMGLRDSRDRAAAAFRRAFELDSGYVRPLGGLIEIAAFERDTGTVRRLGVIYLARDSSSEEADYVRWRLATVLGDARAAEMIRLRFDSLGVRTLDRIQWVGQVDGIALDDADRAMRAILGRASERQERQIAFFRSRMLALNRGRPGEEVRISQAKRELEPNSDLHYGFAIRDALWWDGDVDLAREAVLGHDESLAAFDKLAGPNPKDSRRSRDWLFSVWAWRLWQNDTLGAQRNISRLRRSLSKNIQGPAASGVDIQAEILAGLLALHRKRADDVAASLRLIDSAAVTGCCSIPQFTNLVSARLHEGSGDPRGALAAVRRGRWLNPPGFLSTHLREEGRLAALTGDREGAISAYGHYLILRSDPEPSLRPQAAAVRAELARLERQR
jgi:DNA-binding SARP family transcriptional activator